MTRDIRPIAIAALILSADRLHADEIEAPKPLDDRLHVELFAAEPDIVTVTGLTVDAQGRVLVVESHTHFRPDDYDGPETDRIRLLEDTTGDGRADRVETFFSGTTATMNVAAHPNGWVYVATRGRVFRLLDSDDDGRADQIQTLVRLETEADYPHNGLSGFAFDGVGNVYFGFGENMGEDATLVGGPGHIYFTLGQNFGDDAELVDAQGRRLPALRGSGGVFRCREDGADLERVATGFWNPFHLCFDVFGRLFTGDNDPGNRPPCRFLTIVEGGDYGYRRRTLEPFIAINGETPGTLPMTSSTGESPTGVLAYESDHLPADYRGDLLVASWGENRIDRYHLEREGASFKATTQAMVAGGEHFRPAGIAVAPDGSLYVGDWADRSYPLHKKGRVWHITRRRDRASSDVGPIAMNGGLHSADLRKRQDAALRIFTEGASGIATLTDALRNDSDPRVRSVALAALLSADAVTRELADHVLHDEHEAVREQAVRTLPEPLINPVTVARDDGALAVQAAAMRRIADADAEALLLNRLDDADPFMRQAARRGLGQSVDSNRLVELTNHRHASVRLAAVLLLRGGPNGPEDSQNQAAASVPTDEINAVISRTLHDADSRVRFATVEWIGRDKLQQFRQPLIDGVPGGATTPELFKAYLAALAQLNGVMKSWTPANVGDWWVEESKSQEYVAGLLDDPQTSPAVLQQALVFLPNNHPALTTERLTELLASSNAQLRLEAVRVLCGLKSASAISLVLSLASDTSASPDVRAEAVVGLNPQNAAERDALLELATANEAAVRHEALRTLRGAILDDQQRAALAKPVADDDATVEQLQRLLAPNKADPRPDVADLDAWLALLDGHGDINAGRRVFFHPHGPGCARCHRIDGRGTAIGPSFVRMDGRLALDRKRLIESILQPSKEIDPGYLPVTIVTSNGEVATGIFYKQHSGGVRLIFDSKGQVRKFPIAEIEELVPAKTSIMPDGLVNAMTLQEFRDLIAYLNGPAPAVEGGAR